MVVTVDVQVIGLDKLGKGLGRLPKDAFPGILRGASEHAKRVASEGVGGTAARSIMAESSDTSARTFSLMSQARTISIEEGRKPRGELLHTDHLRRWSRRVGYSDSLFALARMIQRRGVKGRFFMREAHRSTLNILPGLMRTAGDEMRRKFGRL